MSVVCYVEKLTPDKTFGLTADLLMISENMNKFKIQGIQPGDDFTAIVFQAGRYIAVVSSDAEKKVGMLFFDLKNNEEVAKKIATQFEEELRRIFMKNFYALAKNYKSNYNLVLLEVKKASSDISAN